MKIQYQVILSNRKSIQITVDARGNVIVRAPKRISRAMIEEFVASKQDWILHHVERQKSRDAMRYHPTDEEIAAWKQQAKEQLPILTSQWEIRMGVRCTGVKITSAARRWGSCSSRNRICYSWRVMRLPPALREYIVIHELAHVRVKNHSAAFYAEVERWLPDYKQRIAALRQFERENPMD